jgi:hypothetical protein
MPFPLPGDQNPFTPPIPGGQNPSTGTSNPVIAPIPLKNTTGRLLFDRLGETKLTSLKFTDARDGFGKQIDDEPLITKSLPDNPYAASNYVGIAPNEKQAADENKERIKRFFETPRGKEFINKQIGLQLSNTRLEGVQGLSFNIGSININPGLISDAINIGRDIVNNGFNQNNALSAVSLVKRPVSRQAISALQIYNPQNTLDQIGSDPNTGWNHYDRFGATNIILDNDKYLSIVTQNNDTVGSKNNRLISLQNTLAVGLEAEKLPGKLANTISKISKGVRKYTNKVNSYFNQGLGLANSLGLQNDRNVANVANDISEGFNLFNTNLAIADKFIAPIINNVIDQYEGGPGSINGIGPTIIRRFDNTSGKENLNKILKTSDTSLRKTRNLLTGDENYSLITNPTRITKQYSEDTGENLYGELNGPKEISNKVYDHGLTPSYETIRQTNIPKPRKSVGKIIEDETNKTYDYGTDSHSPKLIEPFNKKSADYHYFDSTGKFKVFDRFEPTTLEEKKVENASINRVVFTPINPFTGKPFLDPNLSNGQPDLNAGRIFFDAYISNFKDNFTPTWNDINYIGRSETFHVFTKFKRDISFTLQIPCFNPKQLRNRHRALYELASINAGSYYDPAQGTSGGDQKLGGVITYLRLGNYLAPGFGTINGNGSDWLITGEPGIITNFSITVPNDASWDIDAQLAHYLTVDIGFKLIHNVRPKRQRGGFISGIGEYFESNKLDEATKQRRIAEEARAKAREETQKQAQIGGDFRKSIDDSITIPKFKSYIPKVRKNGVVDEPMKSRYMEAKEQLTGINSEDGVFFNNGDDGEGDF